MADLELKQKRNLVVLGRTGVGKSTVVNQLVGKTVFPVTTSLEGVTRKRRTSQEETEKKIKDDELKVEYKIKIIDTVGLHEKALSSKDVMEDIIYYSANKAPEGINLILFVLQKDILDEEEKEAFDCIIKKFKEEIRHISALVITGCENLGDEEREQLIREVKTRQDTQSFANFMGKGIYPVGFPSLDNVVAVLRETYEKGIVSDTEKLRKMVWDSGTMTLQQDMIRDKGLFNGQQYYGSDGSSNTSSWPSVCTLL